jgi:hypothetical protein
MSDKCNCKFEPTNRFGLYFMVAWIFIDCNGCELTQKTKKMESQLERIEQKINRIAVDTQEVITHKASLEK